MLDEKTEKVLSVVISECGAGYKILCDDDFNGIENAGQILSRLEQLGYVSIRYSSGGEFLVAASAKARVYFDEKQNDYFRRGLLYKKVATFAFLGAAAGSAVLFVFALLIRWIYAG